MAAETLSASSNAFALTFAEEITRLWNRMGTLAQQLPIKSGGGQGGGKSVNWDVEGDGATAVDFAEGSDVQAGEFDFDPLMPAVLPWGQYRASFQISNLELMAAAASIGNAAALEDIWSERVMNKAAKLLDRINADLFTGNGTGAQGNPNIIGLTTALLGTGTYATISKATYPGWAGNYTANGGIARQLTMNLLSTSENLAFLASNANLAFFVTSAGIRTKYEGLFEQVRRTIDDGRAMVPGYEGGTKEYFWRGKPILRDRQNPVGQFFGLDPNEIELRVLPWAPVVDGVPTFMRDLPSSSGNTATEQTTGIPVQVYPLGRTGSGVKFVLEIYLQMKVRKPSAHLWLSDVSEV